MKNLEKKQENGRKAQTARQGLSATAGMGSAAADAAALPPHAAGMDSTGAARSAQLLAALLEAPAEGNDPAMQSAGQGLPAGEPASLSPMPPTEQELVERCETLLQKYKAGKQQLESRIVENERWYRQRHGGAASRNPGDPEPASAWLFNALANKHADAMDSLPTLTVLPREASDKTAAETLERVLPAVLEQNRYEQTYSDMWWYKLRTGTGLTGVFWDGSLLGGLGDVSIRSLDLLNLFWEPGITDIQQSRNVFYVTAMDGEELRTRYPQLLEESGSGGFGAGAIQLARYVHEENLPLHDKLLMIDWYYKRRRNGRDVLHLCKICAGHVLFCSEQEPDYQEGYYRHGRYPFVLDALFPVPESPAGFGYIDICKSAQLYIDKLDAALLKNTLMGARPRFWKKGDGKVNVEQYADTALDFVDFNGSGNPNDSIVQIPVPALNPHAVTMREAKITELKEVSGNRDFSQGATTGGVTAFSAIQALKEAGSKLSRDMIASAYRAFAQVGYLCIDLMRQFYTEPRTFRITGAGGGMAFTRFGAESIAAHSTGDGFMDSQREPVFDLRVIAQKSDPFNSAMQNERAQMLYKMGAFDPRMAEQTLAMLEMMDFDGVDQLKAKVEKQAQQHRQLEQLKPLLMTMAAQLDENLGQAQYLPKVQQMLGGQQAGMMQGM